MTKVRTLISSISICLTLASCASTGPNSDYEYKPKNLTNELKIKFRDEAKVTNARESNVNIEFIEDLSLLQITSKAIRGKVFKRGITRNRVFNNLCNSDEPFFKMVRATGIGLKYKLIDEKDVHKFGPWNVDACL